MKKPAGIVALLCLMGFLAAGSAHAGLMDMFVKKQGVTKEEVYPIQRDEQFQDVKKSYHRTPFGDPELEYEIFVPKDWTVPDTAPTQAGANPSIQLMADLDKFKSPVIYTMQAEVTVQSIKLTREISAANWLRNYIHENHYTFQPYQQVPYQAVMDSAAKGEVTDVTIADQSIYGHYAEERNFIARIPDGVDAAAQVKAFNKGVRITIVPKSEADKKATAAAAAKGAAPAVKKTDVSEKFTDVNTISDKEAIADCIETTPDGGSDFVHMKVLFNGSNAVLVRFEAPDSLQVFLDYISAAVVKSFRFVLQTDHPIEAQKSFNFGDALKFRYPESLDPPKNIQDKDTRHMSMQLFNIKKETEGLDPELLKKISIYEGVIRFVVVRRNINTSLQKEVDDIRHFVEEGDGHGMDLTVKKLMPAPEPLPQVSNRFMFYRYEVYQVAEHKSRGIDKELRFVALGDEKWYVFAILETPSAEEDFKTWAVNTQDFDMIVKDFR